MIAGIDGYLGWSLAQHLAERGHTIAGVDAFWRRRWVEEMGSYSAIPVASMDERRRAFGKHYGPLPFWPIDLRDYGLVRHAFEKFQPEAVVHLGECPSAAYSMIDVEHATFVQTNNITTTFNLLFAIRDICPEAHLLKLGTMGEYGTPDVDIPEGFLELEYRGRRDRLPFPRQAGSWYHWSKVHGSNNIMFACKIWDLRATDIMQGVVFGTGAGKTDDERLLTRLDFDEAFGTIINRFCCQAIIGHPLTVYGSGGQRRGFIPLRDSMRCLTLALENPPEAGEYRVFNQFESIYSMLELAQLVSELSGAEIEHVDNPRIEAEDHYYNPDRAHLPALGYQPTPDIWADLAAMLVELGRYRERIERKAHVLRPHVRWDMA